MTKNLTNISVKSIETSILSVRGERVILDSTLAMLYGVTTAQLNQQVKRHASRFPPDFMFRLTIEETMALRSRSQSVILKRGQNIKYLPAVFTEHGVLMLSSVLSTERAIQVNIEIMRTFVRLRQMLASNTELARKLEDLERRYDSQFKVVFDTLRQLITPPQSKQKQIGFRLKP